MRYRTRELKCNENENVICEGLQMSNETITKAIFEINSKSYWCRVKKVIT